MLNLNSRQTLHAFFAFLFSVTCMYVCIKKNMVKIQTTKNDMLKMFFARDNIQSLLTNYTNYNYTNYKSVVFKKNV